MDTISNRIEILGFEKWFLENIDPVDLKKGGQVCSWLFLCFNLLYNYVQTNKNRISWCMISCYEPWQAGRKNIFWQAGLPVFHWPVKRDFGDVGHKDLCLLPSSKPLFSSDPDTPEQFIKKHAAFEWCIYTMIQQAALLWRPAIPGQIQIYSGWKRELPFTVGTLYT